MQTVIPDDKCYSSVRVLGTCLFKWGSPKFEAVKYGHESRGTLIPESLGWQDPTVSVNHPLIREGAPCQQTCNCLTVIKKVKTLTFRQPRVENVW
jgi:hypothetical protein